MRNVKKEPDNFINEKLLIILQFPDDGSRYLQI